MSVIAWDGKRLAADKRAVFGSMSREVIKIFRSGEVLAGYVGNIDQGEEVLAWFSSGHDPDKFPVSQRDREDWAALLVVFPSGWIWVYERTPYPIKFPPQQYALGSGRDYAMAAMHCGKTAPEAVVVACVFDCSCGHGVDVLIHDPACA